MKQPAAHSFVIRFGVAAMFALSGATTVSAQRVAVTTGELAQEAATLRQQQIAPNALTLKARTDQANNDADSAYVRDDVAQVAALLDLNTEWEAWQALAERQERLLESQETEIEEWLAVVRQAHSAGELQSEIIASLRQQLGDAQRALTR